MRPSRRAFVALGCAAACALAVPAHAVQQPAQPQVGQSGKDAVWLPTPRLLVEKMLDMAAVTPEDFVVDLGSGDGRIVIAAARRGARALGIEHNRDLVELSRIHAAREGVSDRAEFLHADFFDVSLDQATVVTLFLTPQTNQRLRPQLLALRPGTRIVSNTFGIDDWKPDVTAVLAPRCASWCTAHLWIVPAPDAAEDHGDSSARACRPLS